MPIPLRSTTTFSYLIGVGEVNLEPNFSFAVTPEDPDGWNNLSLPHRLTINGEYDSPAGVEGRIEYSVEDNDEWLPLTDMLASGTEFESVMTVMFDENRPKHQIRFRTIDNVGNTTMLQPIEYIDVKYIDISGIEERTYTGEAQIQEVDSEQLEEGQFVTAGYLNNVNAGTASFRIDGVFPYSIGRSSYYDFIIHPQIIESAINLKNDSFIFEDRDIKPEWSFSNDKYNKLVIGNDYNLICRSNRYPGTGTVEVSGIGNYTGVISKDFFIDKAPLTDNLYSTTLPKSDIVYDGNKHEASFIGNEGVGVPSFRYVRQENGETYETVSDAGHYDVYLYVAEGDYYYGINDMHLGSFDIYNFDETEWQVLALLNTQLQQSGFSNSWNVTDGITSVGTFKGLDIKKGHVVGVDLSDSGLSGGFPVSVLALSELKNLDVSGNDLSGDLPMTVVAVASQRAAGLAAIDTLDISGNKFNGNLGILYQAMPSIRYLDASSNKFEDVYPAIPASVEYIDISNQTIERTVEVNFSKLDLATLRTQVPTIVLYDVVSHGFITELDMIMSENNPAESNNSGGDRWSLQLRISEEGIIPFVTGDNVYRGKSGDILYASGAKNGVSNGTTFKVKLDFDQGDANFFNGIDATDLQATILYAFGMYSNLPFNFTAANTYEDDVINVQDVTCTVNIILSLLEESQSNAPSGLMRMPNSNERSEANIILSDGKVILDSEKPVAALTIKAEGDIKWISNVYGFTQSVSGSNLVAYSLSEVELPVGSSIIGEYEGDANVIYASLSDSEAVPVTVSVISDNRTVVRPLPFEIDDNCEIYDVMGVRHTRMVSGLNIIVKDGKTMKYYNAK